jgi:hypothetical protein
MLMLAGLVVLTSSTIFVLKTARSFISGIWSSRLMFAIPSLSLVIANISTVYIGGSSSDDGPWE